MTANYLPKETAPARYFMGEGEEHVLIIIPSGTKEYYHVIYDSAFQDNHYEHLLTSQILSKYKIKL